MSSCLEHRPHDNMAPVLNGMTYLVDGVIGSAG